MTKLSPDPWGNPYVYRFPSRADSETPEIICAGPDGKTDTPDDIAHRI